MPNKLVVIVGPTASGKSALAMTIAQRYSAEIICADSRTVYKGMDIGTAKPSLEDQAAAPHHLLDVLEPGQPFSAAQFKRMAEAAIVGITSRGKLPLLVGGTGLYVDSVIFNYQFGEAAKPEMRRQLSDLTAEKLCELCIEKNIPLPRNSTNRRHLIRAIELGGLVNDEKHLRTNTLVVGIATSRDSLRQRIAARAEVMFGEGVLEEAKVLASKYGWESEAMTGNIYRILQQVIEGVINIDEAKRLFIQSDMRLAKRQMTWFKRNPYIVWNADQDHLLQAIEQFLDTEPLEAMRTK